VSRALALVLHLLCAGAACAQVIETHIDNPRPFGYVVGDVLEQHVTLRVQKPTRLNRERLPKPGKVSVWLELRALDVHEIHALDTTHYRIDATYQVLNAPSQVETLGLPAIRLGFVGGTQAIEHEIKEWPFTLAPITPETVMAMEGLEEMRPERAPLPIDTRAARFRTMMFAALAGAILLFTLYRNFGVPFLSRLNGPFARACRRLRRLPAQASERREAALRAVHAAFNETAGRSLFADGMDRFFVEHPRFSPLRDRVLEFYRGSQAEFFRGASAPPFDLQAMLDLCRALRRCERVAA
jgi:mxaA protein